MVRIAAALCLLAGCRVPLTFDDPADTDTAVVDTDVDTDTLPPLPVASVIGTSAGGGVTSSPGYSLTFTVGDPASTETLRSPGYQLTLGLGAPRP